MKMLLGGQIGLDDFIFRPCKATSLNFSRDNSWPASSEATDEFSPIHFRPKQRDPIEKTQEALGLTITDNGAGIAFIKRIKDAAVISQLSTYQVGDHIEKLNGVELVGCRHFEVAKALKEIPKISTFTIRLVEPCRLWASQIYDLGITQSNTLDFAEAIDDSISELLLH
ncbi:hypothetical protein TCAL_17367 [Tigriopus californicus]|uniref:PDZ domain-containing protein n=1 Tax=Tigriopus californicus TaxID=6832 RepID=A0A553PDS1_TIGCA|nr:hypothetical protein TCAL_17367 [Tigriopus californicus]